MFHRPHDDCRWCAECEATTPHSTPPRISKRTAGIGWIALGGGLSVAIQDPMALFVSVVLIGVGAIQILRARELREGEACDRCRGKAATALRRRAPSLDGNTEINIV